MNDHVSVECKICLDVMNSDFSFKFCINKHAFCKSCIGKYISNQVCDGIVEIKCPSGGCSEIAPKILLKFVLNAEMFAKYERFCHMKRDSNYRECPSCDQYMDFGGALEARCLCGVTSCFEHGGLHPNETCAQFMKRDMKSKNVLSISLIKKITKKCPGCGVNVEKDEGCDDMVSLTYLIPLL